MLTQLCPHCTVCANATYTRIPPGRGRGEGGFHRSPSYEEFSGGDRGGPSGGYYYRGGGGEAPWGGVSPEARGTGFPPTGMDVRKCKDMKRVRIEKVFFLLLILDWETCVNGLTVNFNREEEKGGGLWASLPGLHIVLSLTVIFRILRMIRVNIRNSFSGIYYASKLCYVSQGLTLFM